MVFDITDGIVQDSETGADLNPDRDWVYRARSGTPDELWPARVVLLAEIGQLQGGARAMDCQQIFEKEVRLPRNRSKVPQDGNCVSWALEAIARPMERNLVKSFDLTIFEQWVRQHGHENLDRMLSDGDPLSAKRSVIYNPLQHP